MKHNLRDERAKTLREGRRQDRELRAEIERDQFLQEWLAQAEESQQSFAREVISDDALEEFAKYEGYRSARAWRVARADMLRLLRHFVEAEPFKQFWALLKKNQLEDDYVWGYSPANAGVPSRLLAAMETWHKAPKFTATERRQHSQKIAQASQVLEDLLAQVEPSHDLDGQYSRFRFENKDQAGAVFRVFGGSSVEADSKPFFGTQWLASHNLMTCGVVPLWAVRNIKAMALDGAPGSNPLPAKVRAKAAKKTYFIGVALAAIQRSSTFAVKERSVGPQLVADIVGLLANMDCTADDVRKAMPKRARKI